MSTEQRVRAYYKRYNSPMVRGYGGSRENLLMEICRLFKIPMREVKAILGIVPKPPYPTPRPHSCVDEATGDCLGAVHWYHSYRQDAPYWEGRCAIHHPNWEYYAHTYGQRYWDMIEERHRAGK